MLEEPDACLTHRPHLSPQPTHLADFHQVQTIQYSNSEDKDRKGMLQLKIAGAPEVRTPQPSLTCCECQFAAVCSGIPMVYCFPVYCSTCAMLPGAPLFWHLLTTQGSMDALAS